MREQNVQDILNSNSFQLCYLFQHFNLIYDLINMWRGGEWVHAHTVGRRSDDQYQQQSENAFFISSQDVNLYCLEI